MVQESGDVGRENKAPRVGGANAKRVKRCDRDGASDAKRMQASCERDHGAKSRMATAAVANGFTSHAVLL